MVGMGVAYFYSVYFVITGIVGIFVDYKTPLISTLFLLRKRKSVDISGVL